ncbi:MAG: hypothetical protein OXM57_11795 [bacterium]|nr:hypothetical protein [bacterium]MDE0353362.1 hypothetical protein [bacterium]
MAAHMASPLSAASLHARILPHLGWTVASLIAMAVLVAWLPDLNLPLGDSDDGRLLARFGLAARNFWELGPLESGFGARVDPYIRGEYGVEPGAAPPMEAVTYAHHPPLQVFFAILAVGMLGDSPASLRILGFLVGAATVLFMAAVGRNLGMAWTPILLATGAMAATGFFFVYGRMGGGFSLIAASLAMVVHLREADDPPKWMLAGAAILSCLTAMQSWIAIAALGLGVIWLAAAKRTSEATRYVAFGALAGLAVTGLWLLANTPTAELAGQVTTRVDTTGYTMGEFLARQWRFAGELTPVWWRALAPFALVAGLVDRRTRVPVAITLSVAAALTFGTSQGAWVHRLWNFPWLAPITIGTMALADMVRRTIRGRRAAILAALGSIVVVVTFHGLFFGPTRDTYLRTPAAAGAIVARVPAPEGLMWVAPGIPTPRWISYHLDVPVWTIEERHADQVGSDDLVLARIDRNRDWLILPDESLVDKGHYRLVAGAKTQDR